MLAETNLLTVYATPMLNNKYYYPKLEDLFVGYQCETRYSQSIGEFDTSPSYFCQNEDGSDADCFLKHKDMIPCHPHTITGSDIKDFELSISTGSDIRYSMGVPLKTIRTKFLDREDIESLGFKLEYEGEFISRYIKERKILIINALNIYNPYKMVSLFLKQVEKIINGKVVVSKEDVLVFQVVCKSLNELKTNFKWIII